MTINSIKSQDFNYDFNFSSNLANVDEFLKLKTNPQISATIKKREQIKLESVTPKYQSLPTTTSTPPSTPQSKKQKINLVITTPPHVTTKQQTTPNASPMKTINTNAATLLQSTPHKQQQISLQDLKLISPNKCYLPITLKDGNNDQQIVAQIDTKNLVLPTAYLQMKLQPQITTVDGQHVVQLTNLSNSLSIGGNQTQQLRLTTQHQPATSLPQQIHLHQQHQQNQQQMQQILPTMTQTQTTLPMATSETKTLFTTSTGQSVTITHQPLATLTSPMIQQQQQTHSMQQQQQQQQSSTIPTFPQTSTVETSVGKVQLTMLQNVATTTVPQALPQKSGITIQRIKTEPMTTTTATPTSSQQRTTNYPASTIAAIASMASPPVSISSATLASNKSTNTAAKTTTAGSNRTRAQNSTKRTAIKMEAKSLQTTTTTTATMTTVGGNAKTMSTTTATGTTTSGGTTSSAAAAADGVKIDLRTCDVCEKVFKRKEHLAQHMKLHLGLRPFKCEEKDCNKAFSRKEHLMRHVVSHTGKKMFSCEFCQKLFSRKDNLNKHKR